MYVKTLVKGADSASISVPKCLTKGDEVTLKPGESKAYLLVQVIGESCSVKISRATRFMKLGE